MVPQELQGYALLQNIFKQGNETMDIKYVFSSVYFKMFLLLAAIFIASVGKIYFNLSNDSKLEEVCQEVIDVEEKELFNISDTTILDKFVEHED